MTQGTVKWFSGAKGFGFITPTGGGTDLFFHHSAVQAYDPAGLPDAQAVEYEVGEGRKGPEATAVRAI